MMQKAGTHSHSRGDSPISPTVFPPPKPDLPIRHLSSPCPAAPAWSSASLTDRPSFPCTLAPGSFSNGLPHAKAPAHTKGENLVGQRAAIGCRCVPALRAPWSCAAVSGGWLHVHSPALRRRGACEWKRLSHTRFFQGQLTKSGRTRTSARLQGRCSSGCVRAWSAGSRRVLRIT